MQRVYFHSTLRKSSTPSRVGNIDRPFQSRCESYVQELDFQFVLKTSGSSCAGPICQLNMYGIIAGGYGGNLKRRQKTSRGHILHYDPQWENMGQILEDSEGNLELGCATKKPHFTPYLGTQLPSTCFADCIVVHGTHADYSQPS